MIEGLIVRVPSSGKPITSAFAPEDGAVVAKLIGAVLSSVETRRTATSFTGSKSATARSLPRRDAGGARHHVRVRHYEVWRDEEARALVGAGAPQRENLDDLTRRRGDNLFLASVGTAPENGTVGETVLVNTLGKSALRSRLWSRASAEGTVGNALSRAS